MRKIKKYLIIFFLGLLSITTTAQKIDRDMQKMDIVWKIITNFYVDSVNKSAIAEDAIAAMLKNLDPHSVYYSADEVKQLNEPLNGSFEGVGIQFIIFQDTLMVVQTISGGPCEKVGVMAGDRIVKVNDENIAGVGLKNSDVFKLLKGPKGTEVVLTIKRKEPSKLLTFKVVRDKIPIFSIDAAYMAAPEIGYIKINKFASTTYSEFINALEQLEQSSAKNIILDLRGNGGGYMKAAIDIVDEFIKKKKIVLFTEGRYSPRKNIWATSKGRFESGRLVIILDEGSASASEIVSGAIQDWDRGVIVGRRSFGKGLVQRPFNLPDGSMMRLTISKYYTPSGRCIQKSYEEGIEAYREDLFNRYKHGEMTNADSIHLDESLIYHTLVNNRKVYGGGGIMPDLFVPADTLMYSDYYRELIRSGVLNQFVTSYVDSKRDYLQDVYGNFESFEKVFNVNEEITDSLRYFAEKKDIAFVDEEFQVSKNLIQGQIKALIARGIWSAAEYYRIINPYINSYQEAIRLLSNPKEYDDLLK